MRYKKLGNTDLEASVIGFGCSRIASLTTKYSHDEVSKTLAQALDQGINFYDTADIYGQGDSEKLLGKVFQQHREKVLFCSKAGLTLSAPQYYIRYLKPFIRPFLTYMPAASRKTTAVRQHIEKQCFQVDYIQKQIENSLRRLNTDYMDLFLLHNPPTEVIESAEIFEMLDRLKSKGMIRYYGVSCRQHKDAQLCLQNNNISCLQLDLSATKIQQNIDLLNEISDRQVGIIARECLNNHHLMTASELNLPNGYPIENFNSAQLALKSVVNNNIIDVALVGMACRSHLTENLLVVD